MRKIKADFSPGKVLGPANFLTKITNVLEVTETTAESGGMMKPAPRIHVVVTFKVTPKTDYVQTHLYIVMIYG